MVHDDGNLLNRQCIHWVDCGALRLSTPFFSKKKEDSLRSLKILSSPVLVNVVLSGAAS